MKFTNSSSVASREIVHRADLLCDSPLLDLQPRDRGLEPHLDRLRRIERIPERGDDLLGVFLCFPGRYLTCARGPGTTAHAPVFRAAELPGGD